MSADRSPHPSARSPRSLQPPPTATTAPLALVETAFLASAASLMWLVNYYFPLGPVLRVFFPVPIALVYLRWNQRAAWLAAVVSGLLLSVLMGPTRSVLYVMPYGLMGVLLGWLWRRGAPWRWSIALGTILGAFGIFFRLWLVSLLLGDDLWVYVTTQIAGLLDWVFVKLGLLLRPNLTAVQAVAAVMIVVNNLVYLTAVHLVSWVLLDRLGTAIPMPPRWMRVILDLEDGLDGGDRRGSAAGQGDDDLDGP
ncbi:MAG: DUF2232 domain-containing protein [Cyanobacteria bacterium]|nr:DUF2232 domain-containing protein [Cyanobacteriota bacterium]